MSERDHNALVGAPAPAAPAPASAPGIAPNAATLCDANFNVPTHMQDNTITRHFAIHFNGSLSEMADTPSRAAWTPTELSIFQSRTRYAPNATKSEERQGNLKQAILMGMKVKKVESTFPCQLGIKIAGCKGNYYTGDGQRFAYIIGANESNSHMSQIVATTNPYVNSEYLRLYPGMTKDNLRTNGIMEVPGEQYMFVDQSHPIVEMMSENQDVLQMDLSSAQLIDNRWFKVSKSVTDRCLAELGAELEGNLPVLDLTDFGAQICRLNGASWDSETEVCDNVSNVDMRSKIMDAQRRASVVVEMTYSFM